MKDNTVRGTELGAASISNMDIKLAYDFDFRLIGLYYECVSETELRLFGGKTIAEAQKERLISEW